METSEALPGGAVDLSDLSDLATAEGPLLTIVLATEGDVENAAQRSERRWKTLRSDLLDRHVPEDVLLAVDPLIPDAHRSGDGLLVVADGSGVRHVEHGRTPARADAGWWEPLPRLLDAVRWRQAAVPFVVALADRAGADLYAFRHGPEDAPDMQQEVRGDEFPIRKVKPGGWSQRRYQERAENTWEENAEDVAGAIIRLAGRVDARLVVLAGDERARGLIADARPAGFDTPVEVVHGERPWDGSGPNVPGDVQAVVDRFVELETSALVERFAEERGQGDLAADGAGPTLRALSASQAAVVLLPDDLGDDPRAWSGPAPVPVATDRDDLAALGVENPREVRTIDAAIRAAIATDAGVRLVPREMGPADGVGALLRWSGTA